VGILLLFVWHIITLLQVFFGYGTAYRLTRDGGDNGIFLFGWLFLMSLAALIPGLGFYIWHKNRDGGESGLDSFRKDKKTNWMKDAENKNQEKSSWKNPYDPQ